MDSRLIRLIERLASNPSERPRLPELAREFGMSVRMLELLFTKHTGKPFTTYYRELRIRLAKELLARSCKPVKVIALRLGYKAVEVFCRDFKRECGCTALEYRVRSRKERLQKKSIE
jgi:transcriptional regulator GlxA family with amidase domain